LVAVLEVVDVAKPSPGTRALLSRQSASPSAEIKLRAVRKIGKSLETVIPGELAGSDIATVGNVESHRAQGRPSLKR
jgi:hypothetical protein